MRISDVFFFCAHYRISSDYKTGILSCQNNPKNLDPSYKMDLDLWDCLGRVKRVLYQNFIGMIQLFVVILGKDSPHLIAE